MSKVKSVPFYKMHSLGNDFMVLDAVSNNLSIASQAVQRWSDRHTGIGFDQLLVIEPPTDPDADFYFRIYNADGSSAEQCGNGTRCVAMLVNKIGLSAKKKLTWQSLAGIFTTEADETGQRFTSQLTVPELSPGDIPFDASHAEQCGEHSYAIEHGDQRFTITPVSMGNPHAVIFTEDVINADVDAIGGALTCHPAFPERANVGFCQIMDEQFMRLRVYERGTGETQACGSGACAAAVAAQLNGHTDRKVKISLPGGKLRANWPGPGEPITLTGPANLVYQGDIQLDE